MTTKEMINYAVKNKGFDLENFAKETPNARKKCHEFINYLVTDLDIPMAVVGDCLNVHINKVQEYLFGSTKNKFELGMQLNKRLTYHQFKVSQLTECLLRLDSNNKEFEKVVVDRIHHQNKVTELNKQLENMENNSPPHGKETINGGLNQLINKL